MKSSRSCSANQVCFQEFVNKVIIKIKKIINIIIILWFLWLLKTRVILILNFTSPHAIIYTKLIHQEIDFEGGKNILDTVTMLFLDARIFRQKRFRLSGFSGNIVLVSEFTEN